MRGQAEAAGRGGHQLQAAVAQERRRARGRGVQRGQRAEEHVRHVPAAARAADDRWCCRDGAANVRGGSKLTCTQPDQGCSAMSPNRSAT